jgi:thiol-disulfide isomerase/thioredoxin
MRFSIKTGCRPDRYGTGQPGLTYHPISHFCRVMSESASASAPFPVTVHVACLCAAWCRTCDDYAPVFAAAMADLQLPGLVIRHHWIDIEDESDLVGDLDVETFPTLVVVDPAAVRFAGPLTPQPETLARVLRAALDTSRDGGWSAPQATEVESFARRLRQT